MTLVRQVQSDPQARQVRLVCKETLALLDSKVFKVSMGLLARPDLLVIKVCKVFRAFKAYKVSLVLLDRMAQLVRKVIHQQWQGRLVQQVQTVRLARLVRDCP